MTIRYIGSKGSFETFFPLKICQPNGIKVWSNVLAPELTLREYFGFLSYILTRRYINTMAKKITIHVTAIKIFIFSKCVNFLPKPEILWTSFVVLKEMNGTNSSINSTLPFKTLVIWSFSVKTDWATATSYATYPKKCNRRNLRFNLTL